MRLQNWTIPRVHEALSDLWEREGGLMRGRDLVRRARHHDAAVVEGLRRVSHLPHLFPRVGEIRDVFADVLDPETVRKATAAESFFVDVAGFTGNAWRMQVQVSQGLLYQAFVELQARAKTSEDFDRVREGVRAFYHHNWHKVYASTEAREELDRVALHIGMVWALQALHALHVLGLEPRDLARQSLRKYGHPVCRACLHPVCVCGRVKEGDQTAVRVAQSVPGFEDIDPERLAQGGWKKANVTEHTIQTITFEDLAWSLFHCYSARNATFGGPLEGPSRQRSEATGELDGPAWIYEAAAKERDVRSSAFFLPTGYEEETEIGEDPQGQQMREVLAKEASDACASWPPVYANAMGIPWTHVMRVTLMHLARRLNRTPIELPDSEYGF